MKFKEYIILYMYPRSNSASLRASIDTHSGSDFEFVLGGFLVPFSSSIFDPFFAECRLTLNAVLA
jgi:hypothetical protein